MQVLSPPHSTNLSPLCLTPASIDLQWICLSGGSDARTTHWCTGDHQHSSVQNPTLDLVRILLQLLFQKCSIRFSDRDPERAKQWQLWPSTVRCGWSAWFSWGATSLERALYTDTITSPVTISLCLLLLLCMCFNECLMNVAGVTGLHNTVLCLLNHSQENNIH